MWRFPLLIALLLALPPAGRAADAWTDLMTIRQDRVEIRRQVGELARDRHASRHRIVAGDTVGALGQRQTLAHRGGALAQARARLARDERAIALRGLRRRS